MIGRIPILDVSPVVSCGRWPARAVVGETLPIRATVFREGHDAVAANVVLRGPRGRKGGWLRMRPLTPGTDRWEAEVTPSTPGRWSFLVEAWSDPLGTWRHDATVKVEAGVDVELMLEEGALLFERAVAGMPRGGRAAVAKAIGALRDGDRAPMDRLAPALDADLAAAMDRHPLRELVSSSDTYDIWVDRERALFGSWYEYFPRSEGAALDTTGVMRSGTFATAAKRLPAIAEMGFDVVYLPPIHPIGRSGRKGPNNTLVVGPDDPGVPWAIGAEEGGHDAVHPDLGTIEDFDAFVARARELGMEVALDLALQASPDHPWTREHPEWFKIRADGTIAYAENPPKKYQDIVNVDWSSEDLKAMWNEWRDVVLFWVEQGVKIFRVDNPHTKPINFWEWLITRVHAKTPEAIFLAEAFTKPAMMHELGRIGFSQSYTYFTWRVGKAEIADYGAELVEASDYMRPNFFVNTPDILHKSLQYGGRAMFAIRALLASTLAPSWGVYSGFELFESQAVRHGSEEYLDSEKYQLRPRDYAAALAENQSLEPLIGRLNQIRRDHPALQRMKGLWFHQISNDNLLCYSRQDPVTGDTVLVVVALEPQGAHWGQTDLYLPALGIEWDRQFEVEDLLSGQVYTWGQFNSVGLEPARQVAHVFAVRRF